MVSLFLLRAALAALPFLVWFAWREWARRRGKAVGDTPWLWLFAAAAVLVGLSLLAVSLGNVDTRGQVYVPGEVGADGVVTPGRYVDVKPK